MQNALETRDFNMVAGRYTVELSTKYILNFFILNDVGFINFKILRGQPCIYVFLRKQVNFCFNLYFTKYIILFYYCDMNLLYFIIIVLVYGVGRVYGK